MSVLAEQAISDAVEVLSPTGLNQLIQGRLTDLRGLRVRGEVSNVRTSNGHLYFELRDQSSRIRATAWRSTVQRQHLELRNGQEVICYGYLDLWVKGGTYSLIIQRVETGGVGALWAAFQALKDKLQAEGLFAAERRKPLPFLPATVGIVTARTGAALRDMLHILDDRYPVRVLLAPARVQGEQAVESIATAIELLDGSGLCDVIIAGRGGGSIQDLWAFNEERVVRAFAACQTPIVSAVGHETDTLLSDFAADRRAPTPTAAAEMVVPRRVELVARLQEQRQRLVRTQSRLVSTERRHLGQLVERLGHGEAIAGHRRRLVDELSQRLRHSIEQEIAVEHRRLATLRQRLHAAHPMARLAKRRRSLDELRLRLLQQGEQIAPPCRRKLTRLATSLRVAARSGRLTAHHQQRFAHLDGALRALNPRAALARGYSIIRSSTTRAALNSSAGVAVGEHLEVVLAEGGLDVVVEQVQEHSKGRR